MIPLRLYSLILVVSGVVLAIYLLLRRKPKTADDLERARVGAGEARRFVRIARGVVEANRVVEVRPRGAVAGSNVAQDVAAVQVLAGSYRKVPELCVTGGNPANMINDYGPTVAAHKV